VNGCGDDKKGLKKLYDFHKTRPMPPPTSYKVKRDAMQAFALLGTKKEMKTPETINPSKKRKQKKDLSENMESAVGKRWRRYAKKCRQTIASGNWWKRETAKQKKKTTNLWHRLIQNGSKMLSLLRKLWTNESKLKRETRTSTSV